jgi:PGF-pre-PGF domain-containing protein
MPSNTIASGTNSNGELAEADSSLSGPGPIYSLVSENAGAAICIKGELYNNECANISVTTKNNGEISSEGHIIVSFPNNEEILSMGGSGDRVEFYPHGNSIEEKELAQQFISNGTHAKFVFEKNATSITYIEFDPKKTFGKITTIVETLKEKSTQVTELPSGKVYDNTNIWVGNEGSENPENIENAIVGFKVEKTWINSNGMDPSSVKLWKFDDGKWVELFTIQTSEDDDYVYYEADTPGFSAFSIMALYPEEDPEGTYRALANSVYDKDFKAVLGASGEKESDVIDSEVGGNNSKILGNLKKGLLQWLCLLQ